MLKQGLLHLNDVLKQLEPLHTPVAAPGSSVLLRELVSAPSLAEATSNPTATPLLHSMAAAHAYITMFVHVCRTGQADIRTISISHWGSELGLQVKATFCLTITILHVLIKCPANQMRCVYSFWLIRKIRFFSHQVHCMTVFRIHIH